MGAATSDLRARGESAGCTERRTGDAKSLKILENRVTEGRRNSDLDRVVSKRKSERGWYEALTAKLK